MLKAVNVVALFSTCPLNVLKWNTIQDNTVKHQEGIKEFVEEEKASELAVASFP